MQNEENFKDRYKDVIELFAPTEKLTVSIGSMFGDLLKEIVMAQVSAGSNGKIEDVEVKNLYKLNIFMI